MKSKKFPIALVALAGWAVVVLLSVKVVAQVANASPAAEPSPFVWPPTAATVLIFWPIVSGLVSLVYNKLDGLPRVHAVLSLLVKCGVDLPGILDALKRALTGAVTAERAAKMAAGVVKPMVLVLGVLTLVSATACTPAQQAEMSQVEQVVLQDVESGKTIPQIEVDVATVVAGKLGADVVLLVDDALTFLIDMGLVPAQFLPYAKQLAASQHPRALAHRSPTVSMLHPVDSAQASVDTANSVVRAAGGQ